jgi:hypothetical protein
MCTVIAGRVKPLERVLWTTARRLVKAHMARRGPGEEEGRVARLDLLLRPGRQSQPHPVEGLEVEFRGQQRGQHPA